MILSASRRTDIPALYSDWFFNRIKEGFVYARNPMNPKQISKVSLSPELIDCIVFWTKNPRAMLDRLDELDRYNYYFQFTVNPYDTAIEVHVPKKNAIISTFKRLSDTIGRERVIWRYDPILFSDEINIDYHIKYFEALAQKLEGYTDTCVISFLDNYKKSERNLKASSARVLTTNEVMSVAEEFAQIAQSHSFKLESCAEEYDLSQYGIIHGKCIDDNLIEKIIGAKLSVKKDKNQRKDCRCVESIDIGEYNTCTHNCLYCYACFNVEIAAKKQMQHDPYSPLLVGYVSEDDVVSVRKMHRLRSNTLF